MPSIYIHEYIAVAALGRRECEASPAALALGAYGPDALYYHDPLAAGRRANLGQRLHSTRTGDFILELMRACAASAVARDYARGFLTHYAADCAFHPFVCALSMTPLGYSSLRHMAVERALDAWLTGLAGTHAHAALDEAERVEIARAFCTAVARWSPDAALTLSDMLQAMRRCRMGRVLGRLGEPGTLRVSSESGDTSLTPEQLQAHALRGWVHPWTGLRCHDGPFELLGTALGRAGEMIAATERYWRGPLDAAGLRAVIGDMSYMSGIDWRDTRPLRPIELERLRAMRAAFRRQN